MGISYSQKTMINIFTNEINAYSGTYSRSSGLLTLGENSWVNYVKEYSPTENPVNTDSMQMLFDVAVAAADISSRYNCNIKANLKVQYYATVTNEDGSVTYTSGQSEMFCFTPYFSTETDGKISIYSITLKEMPIQKLELYILNTTSFEIDIVNFGIFNSLSLDESLGNGLVIEVVLRRIQFWRNGIKVIFNTGDLDLKALKSTETQKFAGYNVNDKLVIQCEDIDADL